MRNGLSIGILLTLVISVLLSAVSLYAQVSPSTRDKIIREARDLARMGNREAAIRRMESLYARAPLDGTVVQRYAALLAEAGHLDKAKAVLTDYTGERGDDTKALSALASLHFQSGETGKGMGILESMMARAPKEHWPYHVGLDVLLENDMKQAIISHISRARRALGDSALFAIEAARVHRDMKRFGLATHEYLLAGTAKNMSAEIASQYIVDMARDDEARPEVTGALERLRSVDAFAWAAALTLGEVYLMDGDCARALDMISKLVSMDPSNAGVLIIFAREASESGCFGECAKAYDLAMGHLDKEHKKAEYMVEKARCEEKAGLLEDALTTFDRVAHEYDAFKYADEALMGRARIYRDMGELEKAIAEAGRVMGSRYSDNVFAAILFQGDCRVLLDRLDEAFETYDRVGKDWVARYAQEAYFNLGEVSFYRGEFDDAQSYYNVTLRQYPDEPRANDAIDRLLLIKSAGGDGTYSPELARLGRAMLLGRQGKLEAAGEILADLGGMEGDNPVRVESLMLLSAIRVKQGAYEEAVSTYKLIGDSLETRAAPTALEAVGDIYLSLGRTDDAVSAYEDVILRFPASVSAGEARRKIDLATKEPDDDA